MKRTIYIFVLLLSVFLVYFLGSKNKIVDNSALGKVKEYSRMMYLSENEMYSKLNQDDFSNEEIIDKIKSKFNLTPNGIIEYLKLKNPNFKETTTYGHFGKSNLEWEKIIKM